jgi:hypothetical protein
VNLDVVDEVLFFVGFDDVELLVLLFVLGALETLDVVFDFAGKLLD